MQIDQQAENNVGKPSAPVSVVKYLCENRGICNLMIHVHNTMDSVAIEFNKRNPNFIKLYAMLEDALESVAIIAIAHRRSSILTKDEQKEFIYKVAEDMRQSVAAESLPVAEKFAPRLKLLMLNDMATKDLVNKIWTDEMGPMLLALEKSEERAKCELADSTQVSVFLKGFIDDSRRRLEHYGMSSQSKFSRE